MARSALLVRHALTHSCYMRVTRPRLGAFLVLLSFAGFACKDGKEDPLVPDAGGDDGGDDAGSACEPMGDFEVADPDGAADPLDVPAGEARVGRLDAASLPADRFGLARWHPGDFVLANENVAFVVTAAGVPGEAYDPHGGRLVGLGLMQDGAIEAPADFGIVVLALQRFLVDTSSVSVVADGTDGEAAVLRVAGRLARLEAFGDLLDGLLPQDYEGLPAAITYTLEPGASHATLELSVRAGARGFRAPLGVIQAFFQSSRMPAWRPGVGIVSESSAAVPYVAFDGSGAPDGITTSYAWMSDMGTLSPLIQTGGADVFSSGRIDADPCGEITVSLGRVVVGADLPDAQARVAALDGTTLTEVSGRITVDGAAATGARVHLTADDEHLTRFVVDEDGSFSVNVDARATQLWVWRDGFPLAGPFDLVAGGTTVDLPASATVNVRALDLAGGGAIPARVEIFPRGATPLPVGTMGFGESGFGSSRVDVRFATDGLASFELAPGTYRLRVSRGPAWERFETDLDLAADDEVNVAAELERVVAIPGVLCADYHVHTHRSVDSGDDAALKVSGLVADGLDLVVRSEHEFVSDFQPLIESLGLASFARGFGGMELTTFQYGHFGVFPLEADTSRPSDGAIRWYGVSPPDLFDTVRARPESPTLIINHPRAGGTLQAYFEEVGFDPVTGSVRDMDNWDEDFEVVEVFNDSDFESNRDGTVRDWFGLLNAGRRVAAVGSSDSHGIHSSPVGYPRTCLEVGTDDVRSVTASAFQSATAEGRSVVTGGIYLEITGPGGAGPGDDATGVGARASFEVVVRAASHVEVNRLEVIVDGMTAETLPIEPGDAEAGTSVRARMTIEADVASSGSWVVFHAAGDTGFDAQNSRPFAISNPVYLTR
ncbi:MAG: CehA/McbA family metallohydrolase [Myxococcales bacterium]|nr:CehA/McbA family metallohydrolase [Myxococcales bacterium]